MMTPTAMSTFVRAGIARGDSFVLELEAVLPDAVEEALAPLRVLQANLARRFAAAISVHLYLSAPDADVLAPHADPSDIFILQLDGRKRWQICVPRAALGRNAPDANGCEQYTHGDMLRMDRCRSLTLSAGELLYVPKGFVHVAHTLADEQSTHVTLGIEHVKSHTANLTAVAVAGGTLADDPDWKACVASGGLTCSQCNTIMPPSTCLYVHNDLPFRTGAHRASTHFSHHSHSSAHPRSSTHTTSRVRLFSRPSRLCRFLDGRGLTGPIPPEDLKKMTGLTRLCVHPNHVCSSLESASVCE
jgi:hypothetical protein